MTNILETTSKQTAHENEDGLMAQLKPNKDRMNALQKVIDSITTEGKRSMQDGLDIARMQQEITELTNKQREIMDEYDKKYLHQTAAAPGVLSEGLAQEIIKDLHRNG